MSLFFFFSSRRRHTRLTCDWSSDVCSSDLPELSVSAVAVSCRREGSRAPNEAPGTLGSTIWVGSPLERAGAMGGSNVSLHAAGVVGTGLTSVDGHADCPTGTAGVPGTESPAEAPTLHAAAGPDSWHCGWPAGRLNRASLSTATALMQFSIEQADWVGLSAGTASTVGVAARTTTVMWLEIAMNARPRCRLGRERKSDRSRCNSRTDTPVRRTPSPGGAR